MFPMVAQASEFSQARAMTLEQLERQRRESEAAQEDSPAVSPDLSPQGAPRRVAVAAGFLLSCFAVILFCC